jgi:hypothetical protein
MWINMQQLNVQLVSNQIRRNVIVKDFADVQYSDSSYLHVSQ